MTGLRSGRSSLALAFVLAALAAIGTLAWLVRARSAPSELGPDSLAEASGGGLRVPEHPDTIEDAAHESQRSVDMPRDPSTNSEASLLPATARIHAASRDARSGAAIPGLRLEFVEEVSAPSIARAALARASVDGIVERDNFPSGRWRITASSARHRALVLGSFETSPSHVLDLGRITLDPLPVHEGRLRDEFGEPARGQWITFPFGTRAQEEVTSAVTNGAGEFELVGDLPTVLIVQVNPGGPRHDLEGQRFAFDQWPSDAPLDLRLAPYQHVTVGIYGFAADPGELRLFVCPAAEESTEFGRHIFPDAPDHEPLVRARVVGSGDDPRRFEFYVPAGRFAVWGGSRSREITTSRFVVAEGVADSEFHFTAH